MSSSPSNLLVTLYEWTSHLMPAPHRSKYGDEQVRLFEQLWREESPSGAVARLLWAARLLGQSVMAAVGARVDHWRRLAPRRGSLSTGGGSMRSDFRFTLRAVKAAPWYATAVIAVTAVTVALATTTFAIVDGVLFRPLPYPNARALVSIEPAFATVPPPVYRDRATFSGYSASEMDVRNWQASVPEVQMTAFRGQSWAGLDAADPETITGVA